MITEKQAHTLVKETLDEFKRESVYPHCWFNSDWLPLPEKMSDKLEITGKWHSGYPPEFWYINREETTFGKFYELDFAKRRVKFIVLGESSR